MGKKILELQEIQQESFKVLLKIKQIFDENNWKYYLTYGTLIGAVRHKGFIPWDDDIDIWVPRPDYEKFIDYCIKNKEKLKPFELHHYRTNPKYIYTIARFSDSRYEIDYDNIKYYGLGLFVDIYPLDGYILNNKNKIKRIRSLIHLLGSNEYQKSDNKVKNAIKFPFYFILKCCGNRLKSFLLTRLLKKNDMIAKKHPYEKFDVVGCTCWENDYSCCNKSDLSSKKDLFLEFNGEKFRVPVEYNKILKNLYGDYMELPPEEDRISHHHYKAYRKN